MSALQQLVRRAVDTGLVPGAVAVLGADEPEVACAGRVAVGGRELRPDDLFRIQSMTKTVTAVAALRLVERGVLTLDDPVEPWLPELADRRVLASPDADLDDTVPAVRPLTLRHLLSCTSGYGMVVVESPLQTAMRAAGVEAGPLPSGLGASDWLVRLARLPLAFQPGEGWRYHHSYAVLGLLLARLAGGPVGDHLAVDLFGPLGMTDTGYWVPVEQADRLPAAYRHRPDADGGGVGDGDGDGGGTGPSDGGPVGLGDLEQVEPAAGGPYVGPPPHDVSHEELVSTAADYHRFARALAANTDVAGRPLLSAAHRRLLASDQVPAAAKTPDSFFSGFWDAGMGWGFGVGVTTTGPHGGRFGWSGGMGTDYFVDPDGTVGVLLTQVELGQATWSLLTDFHQVRT